MTVIGFLWAGAAAVAAVYLVGIFNGLVRLKHNVKKNWSNIDVLLKQRHDELPKLVETCKQYMKHERETLEKVMQARSAVASAQQAGDMAALGSAEGILRRGLGQLFAVAESYPDLKANQTFHNLQGRITQLENAISDRRELYNESVNINNTRIEQFPDRFVASWGDFGAFELLKFDKSETEDVNVKSLFS